MYLSALHTYPVKSLRGLNHQQVHVNPKGAEWDRRWMLVDSNSIFISQRQNPALAQVSVEVDPSGLTISAPEKTPLRILRSEEGQRREVTVWKSICRAIDQGAAARQWFSEFLEMDCSLVYLPEDSVRNVSPSYAKREIDQVGFADGYPFLIVTEASLADLNGRLEKPIPMNRFRPNIVIKNEIPFEEDHWKTIQIGDIIFDLVKPCGRCVVTTTDQQTGERSSLEPMITMAKYRKFPDKNVVFGKNSIHRTTGILKVGDKVTILE